MKRILVAMLVVLSCIGATMIPVVADTVLFEDDFVPNGAIDALKWNVIGVYTAQDSFAVGGPGAKIFSSSYFDGTAPLLVEFLGVKFGAPGEGDNFFGMFDIENGWLGFAALGFKIDSANEVGYYAVNGDWHVNYSYGTYLDQSKIYDFRIAYTPGGDVSFYWNEAGQPWELRTAFPASPTTVPTRPLKIEAYTDTLKIDFDKIVLSKPGYAVSGRVVPSDYSSDLDKMAVNIEFLQNDIVASSYIVMLDNAGNFSVPGVNAGTYDVRIKAYASLSALVAGVNVSGITTIATDFILPNGDLDGDNEVTSTDLSILGLNLGMTGN